MNQRKNTVIVILSCSIMGIYGFINSKAAFYNIIKLTFHFTDIQLGNIWSVYGMVSLASYLLGGYFADRVSVKKLVIAALSLAAVLHLYLSFVPAYTEMLILSGLLSIASICTFFPASSKLLSHYGGKNSSGGVFGLYYALEGIWNTALNLIGTAIFQQTQDARFTFVCMMRAYVVINIAAAIVLVFLLPDMEIQNGKNKIAFSDMVVALKKKEVWLIAVTTMCIYMLFCSFTYITPYLTELYRMKEEENLLYGIVRADVMSIIGGVIFGKWANHKKSAVSVIRYGLELSIVCSLLISINTFTFHNRTIIIALTMFYSLAVVGTKSISIAMISEQELPPAIIGTVIGVVSFIGFSPDAFFYSIMGRFFTYFNSFGYKMMFVVYICMALIGVVCCILIKRWSVKS